MAACKDTRPCFAKRWTDECVALSETYEKDGECPFCKDKKEVTNGKSYPYRAAYTEFLEKRRGK